MKSDRKGKHRIPIRFMDAERDTENEILSSDREEDASLDALSDLGETDDQPDTGETSGGPDTAELIATRSELKRIEAENAELKDRLARRQADFENYRKRVERERSETYNRVVADVAAKLLPVSDNLKRALDAESSVEAAESDEFRHFLSGVDLIWKQLNGVLEALGVKPIPAVGEHFDPHVHEAVVTEATDEYEPDTVMQEIVAGYRLGDKLIRPALVKVATRK
jgi:molecular chaperone GrpE